MTEPDVFNPTAILQRIREQADVGKFRLTQHAQQEMVEEKISLDEVLEAVESAEVLENYPHHRRGSCCLLHGITAKSRDLHLVCTAARPVLIIITVYQPKPPKWLTPTERERKP